MTNVLPMSAQSVANFTQDFASSELAELEPNAVTRGLSRGIYHIHGYRNYHTNFCGAAAIATMWDFRRFDPGYAGPRVVDDFEFHTKHWHDMTVVGEICKRFPNNGPLGMDPMKMVSAFKAAGFKQVGARAAITDTFETISPFLPVVCLVRCDPWGGQPGSLHYVVVYDFREGHVWFTNPPVDPVMPPGQTFNSSDPAKLSLDNRRFGKLPYDQFGAIWTNHILPKCWIWAF